MAIAFTSKGNRRRGSPHNDRGKRLVGFRLRVSFVSGIRWQDDGALFVPSGSEPNKEYRLVPGHEGELTCACAGFGFRKRCSHIRRAAAFLELYMPRTTAQDVFTVLTYRDPSRVALRSGKVESTAA